MVTSSSCTVARASRLTLSVTSLRTRDGQRHTILSSSRSIAANSRATIWHRSQGDVGPFGRCDLVFVVEQEQHPVFERLGDDLWYYDRTPVKATKLFYVGWARPARQSCTKHERYNGQYRRVAAVGSMLYALLGFDRSGIGEALVAGHGMPLRPTNEREELEGIASERDKGDLVVKFPIELPRGVNGHAASAPRLHLAVGGPLPMAPIVLLMPEEASGRPSASALRVLLVNSVLPAILQWVHRQRFMCQAASGGVSPAYPPPLLGDEDEPWLQGKLPLSALPPVRARPFGPTELIGVCLLVGGPPAEACPMASSTAGVAGPSDASWALMAALSHSLPALQWRVIHMAGCVSEPLLADEELLVESACLLLLDALPDVEPAADVPSIVGCIGEGDGADAVPVMIAPSPQPTPMLPTPMLQRPLRMHPRHVARRGRMRLRRGQLRANGLSATPQVCSYGADRTQRAASPAACATVRSSLASWFPGDRPPATAGSRWRALSRAAPATCSARPAKWQRPLYGLGQNVPVLCPLAVARRWASKLGHGRLIGRRMTRRLRRRQPRSTCQMRRMRPPVKLEVTRRVAMSRQS